jgi:hypothetical protein
MLGGLLDQLCISPSGSADVYIITAWIMNASHSQPHQISFNSTDSE